MVDYEFDSFFIKLFYKFLSNSTCLRFELLESASFYVELSILNYQIPNNFHLIKFFRAKII